jgi:RHS repeat-associated protein
MTTEAHNSRASTSDEIRLNGMTYPNGRQVNYNFASGMDSTLNRVTSISDSSATLASYTYLGLATVVRITYPQPSIWLDLWGGTSGTFNGLDLFGRITDQRWQKGITGTPTDIDRYQYGYDLNSNRLWKANVVGTAAVSSGLDELYVYDPLQRLYNMQRGVLNSTKTAITGTPSAEQDWTLDPVGNWSGFITKASGTTTLNQSRTANKVNEITNITESTGPTWIVPAYDAAGNTITMPQPGSPASSFTAVYDAWNRMVSISAGATPVGKYQYDGRNFRIVKLSYTSGTLSETRHFYYARRWRSIEERVGASTSMDKQYVYGVRYIDELVCRDDATPERLYAAQDANFNLTSISNIGGRVQERYLFDPYGNRTIMTSSWAIISSSAYNWIIGHQGLLHDPESGLIYNRMRPIHPMIGRPGGRDPIGYVAGISLYQYQRSSPVVYCDPFGLDASLTLCIGYGSSLDVDPAGKYMKDWLNKYLAALNSALAECRKQGFNIPDATIASNDTKNRIDDSKYKQITTNDGGIIDALATLVRGTNQQCIPVLFSSVKLGDAGGSDDGLGNSSGIIMQPEPGVPEDYNVLAHECGHYAGYDCGDETNDKGGKAHSKDPKNVMYPDTPDDPTQQKPDKCWCKKMLAVASR